jgi:TonB family protein
MQNLCLALLLLPCPFSFAQSTISVDALSVMQVCHEKHPESAGMSAAPPHVMSKVDPIYPEKARQSRTEGIVVLGLIVQKDGSPRDIHPVSSPSELLSQAAIEAVRQWKFDPPTYQGGPVDAEIRVQVSFKIGPNAPPQPSSPKDVNTRDETRNLRTNADETYAREDYQTAANICRRIIDLAPQDSGAWNLLGRSLLALDELDAAADAFANSIRFYPASTVAYNNLGWPGRLPTARHERQKDRSEAHIWGHFARSLRTTVADYKFSPAHSAQRERRDSAAWNSHLQVRGRTVPLRRA